MARLASRHLPHAQVPGRTSDLMQCGMQEPDATVFKRLVDYCANEAKQFLQPMAGKAISDSVRSAYVKWIAALGSADGILQTQYTLHTNTTPQLIARAWGIAQGHDPASGADSNTPFSGLSAPSPPSGSVLIAKSCIGMTNQLPHQEITVVQKYEQGEVLIELGYKSNVGLGMLLAAVASISPAGNGTRIPTTPLQPDRIVFSATVALATRRILQDGRLNMGAIDPVQRSRALVM